MGRKNRRKASADTSSSSIRKKHPANPKRSKSKKMEDAKDLAYEKARIKKRMMVCTEDKSYKVLRMVSEGIFGYLYEVKEKEGEIFYLKTEPLTTDKDMDRFKILKYEEVILVKALLSKNKAMDKLPRFYDTGCTDNFKFLVMQPFGESLHDIAHIHLKSAFSMSTALRTAIQTLQAITALHKIGFLHRGLSPMSFFVGAGPKMRTVYMGDFGVPYVFRNRETGEIRKPRSYVPMMGVLNYMSRAAQKEKEHARCDDLESWIYITMEFFDLDILPWSKAKSASEILRKKQKTIDGDYPSIFEKISLHFASIIRYVSNLQFYSRPNYEYIQDVLMEIRKSKKVDFNVPYDWEVLTEMRDKLEADPITKQKPDSLRAKSPARNSGVRAVPRNEVSKEENVHSPNPASSELSNEQNIPPKAAVVKTNQTKPTGKKSTGKKSTENVKSEYYIPPAERRISPATPKKSQSVKKDGNQNEGSPDSDDEEDERR